MSDGLVHAAQQFAVRVENLEQSEILDDLHDNVARRVGLNMLGAWRVPHWARGNAVGNRRVYAVQHHASLPAAFWPEFWQLYAKHGRSFLAVKGWRNSGAFTMTEALRELKPMGDERWIQRLLYKHGVRDVFYVPCGEWIVVYWSPKVLPRFDAPTRAALTLAAGAAAERLRRLTGRRDASVPDPGLSAQQRAVLRVLAYNGDSLHDVAKHLNISYGTAYAHAERARKKLGAKSHLHAVVLALNHYVVLALACLIGTMALCNPHPPDRWFRHVLEDTAPHAGKV